MKKLKSTLISLKNRIRSLPLPFTILIHWIAIPFAVNTALNLFFFTTNDFNGSRHFGGMLFSYLFTCILYAFLLTICNRETIAASILCAVYFLLGYGNYVKMVVSGMNPLFLSDLLFITDTESLSTMVGEFDLPGVILECLPQTLLFLFLLSLVLVAVFFLGYRVNILKARLITLSATLLILLLVFIPFKGLHSAAYSLFFREKAGHDPIVYYNEKGFVSGIIGQYWNSHPVIPDTKEQAAEILEALPPSEKGTWGKPNIIVIFSESFFDVSKWSDVTFSEEPTANYTALKEKGISFSMLSPTIGGLSCNSEYQILSGGNMAYYPLGTVPYTMYYDLLNQKRYQYPAIIRDLEQSGYETIVASMWAKNLCNCDVVYESMGLDTFYYDCGEEIKGLYYSDKTVGDLIKRTFSEKTSENPLFYFTQTSQAHMPFFADKYESYDLDVVTSPFNEKETGILQSYVQGIYDADKMLGDVYNYIQTLNEPTVLLFFGDHLPNLTDCSRNLFDKLDYFNTEDALLNEARRYTTEGLILANFPISDEIDYLGQDTMLPYLLSKTSVELSPYYRYLVSEIDTLPTLGTFAAYDKNGKLYKLSDLPADMKEVYDKRRILQYALFP